MMSVGTLYVYDEIVNFLTSQPPVEEIVAFDLTSAGKLRVRKLVEKDRNGTITNSEQAELNEFMRVEGFLRKLKARAQRRLDTLYR
jgi:hypothetical protein